VRSWLSILDSPAGRLRVKREEPPFESLAGRIWAPMSRMHSVVTNLIGIDGAGFPGTASDLITTFQSESSQATGCVMIPTSDDLEMEYT